MKDKIVRLNIPILESEKYRAKVVALENHMSLKDFVLEAIAEKIGRCGADVDTICKNDI